MPPYRVLTRHLLPNIAEPLLVLLSVAFAGTLTALSGLSFLGLGVQPPAYDWGRCSTPAWRRSTPTRPRRWARRWRSL
nr:hypothetical protein GCM10020093_011950 [Planobispora longispora]